MEVAVFDLDSFRQRAREHASETRTRTRKRVAEARKLTMQHVIAAQQRLREETRFDALRVTAYHGLHLAAMAVYRTSRTITVACDAVQDMARSASQVTEQLQRLEDAIEDYRGRLAGAQAEDVKEVISEIFQSVHSQR